MEVKPDFVNIDGRPSFPNTPSSFWGGPEDVPEFK
jgi:hypothetical protein